MGSYSPNFVWADASGTWTRSATERGHCRLAIGENHRKGGVKGFDFHKKVKGRKRHILVDTEGLLLVVQVTAANIQDHHQAFALLNDGRSQSARLEKVWVDEGYQSKELAHRTAAELGIIVEIVPKPSTQTGFQVLARRWVVERTFAWLGRYRRLSKDYEYYPETSQAVIQLAMSHVMLRRLARLKEVG
jgi:putative transposase